MIKVEFNKQSLEVPNQWSDIQLADYEKWFENRPATQHEYVQLVADICKLDSQQLLTAPRQLFDMLNETIKFVFDTDVEPKMSVKIDDEVFVISPSDELTLGEWVDIDTMTASDSLSKISDTLAIVCRPIGEAYDSHLFEERKLIFRTLPCDQALPLLAFFLHRKQELDEILNHYSTLMHQASQFLSDTKGFAANGVGIKLLPIWQRIRYTYLIRSLEKQLSKCLAFSSIA